MIRLKSSAAKALRTKPNDLQVVRAALQQAVELEHSTIPPYLYALYSLDPAKNAAIAEIIQSVVMEEMLHMTLSCNVLNALGGTPVIDKPSFIPSYPGPLPGGVESELSVKLAPFSTDQLETFLVIEQPEDPLVFKAAAATDVLTIGEFYAAIATGIKAQGDGAFVKPAPHHQVGPEMMDDSVVVTDVDSALRAIDVIVEQGEGTRKSPQAVVGGGYAHYYRFMQIKNGCRLVKQPGELPPEEQYAYNGAPIPFDAGGVYNAPTDPKAAQYPNGSAQRFACDNFNYTYTNLLGTLHATFNGQPNQLDAAIGLMMSLKGQAKNMMMGIPNPKVITGPSFEYCPVNPSNEK